MKIPFFLYNSFLILVLLIPFQISAQNIRGKVKDSLTGKPLSGANVALTKNGEISNGFATNIEGEFNINEIPKEAKYIRISYIGYKTKYIPLQQFIKRKKTVVKLLPSSLNISQVEIFGYKNKNIRHVPGAASKLPIKTVDLVEPVGTQEMLQYVPGITGFADDGMGNSRINIGMRGLNPRRSSRILFLEDGIPVQPALYVFPNMYYNPPAERIEKFEVLKSSSAIKFGPQTMGGVINYITSKPRREFGGGIQLTGGLNNYRSAFAEAGGFGNGKIDPQVQLLYKSGDGFRKNNHFEQWNTTTKARITTPKNKRILIKANVNYENSKATYTGLTEYSFRNNPRFNPKDHDSYKIFRTSLDVIIHNRLNQNLNSVTKIYSSYFDRNWWREFDIFVKAEDFEKGKLEPVPWYSRGDLVRTGNGKNNFGILRSFYTLGIKRNYQLYHNLLGSEAKMDFGGRIHWERFEDQKKIGSSPDAREGFMVVDTGKQKEIATFGKPPIFSALAQNYETIAFSGYLLENWEPINNLNLSPGFRVEVFEQERIDRLAGNKYQDKTTAVILPGLGFNYNLKHFDIFGGVHRGFTPPSSGALKILNFGSVKDQGIDLKAEKSWNYETGVRGYLDWVTFQITGFQLDIEDMVAAGRGTAFKNLGRVTNMGVENTLEFHLSEWNSILPDFHFIYTYLNTEVTQGKISTYNSNSIIDISGNKLPYAPTHSFVTGLTENIRSWLNLRVDLKYTGKVYTDFENLETTSNRGDKGPIEPYYILNASAQADITKNWKVFATGKNLLDKVYIGSRLHSNPGQPHASLSSGILPGFRRQVNIGIEYHFGK